MAVNVDLRFYSALSSFELRSKRYASDDMLLLLDWDDTIFPTSYLESRNIEDPSEASERLKSVIRRVERRAISLVNSRAVDNVAIVTTASKAWVQDCLTRWMPLLRATLQGVQILSASENYSGDGYDRKFKAFQAIYDYEDEVVVVGDGPFEKWAARALANIAPNVSFIGFIDDSTPEQLVEQLEFVHRSLRPLANRYEATEFQLCFGADSDSD